ncbi:MAG: hypothetical protein WC992_03080 [Acholeplasmataceae bacterium]|jgi:hypothetical protein
MAIEFRTCPKCNGYGVLDSGKNCINCGGRGRGGLNSTDGCIGSGEVMFDTLTGRRVTAAELVKMREAER